MTEHNSDNVEKLVDDIVQSWDFDTLIDYAYTKLTNHYMKNEEEFQEEWEDFYE